MFVFRKIWHALFSCNIRFEIRPFTLLPTYCSPGCVVFRISLLRYTKSKSGSILESKGMRVIFQKKGKKWQNIWKFRQKCTKFENILEKGSLMRTTIACMKQLKYTQQVGLQLPRHYCYRLYFLHGYICRVSFQVYGKSVKPRMARGEICVFGRL